MAANLLAILRAAKKTDNPWTRGEPTHQPWYEHTATTGWQPVQEVSEYSKVVVIDKVSLLSWNIDQFRAYEKERMEAALKFLGDYLSQLPQRPIIMLNEVLSSGLDIIRLQPWIREGYYLTDISHEFWESSRYGTCVLIPTFMSIDKIFRVHYDRTDQERDGLFIDVRVVDNQQLRICSTHLESLVADPPIRPSQLATASKWMHKVDASILGGDLNAIQPFDKTLHAENGLKDAYLQSGGKEDEEAGMTWGQMATRRERSRFGLSRMDKFMFCGNIEIEKFELFGADAIVEEISKARFMVEECDIEQAWVTDHLGIRADFNLTSTARETSNL